MTLLESVVASLLFASVATASLGIWSLGLTAEASRSAQERSLDQLDAAVVPVAHGRRTHRTPSFRVRRFGTPRLHAATMI
jgi:hypothetical protein